LLHKCTFVDPEYNFPCNKKSHTKIVINIPNKKEPIVEFACERHGDQRFNYLSLTESKLTKSKDTNKISYVEFSEQMKNVRWKQCRRCNGVFNDSDMVCCLEYYFVKDIRISMRRSFLLHSDCLASELRFYSVQKIEGHRETTLDVLV
jgi:hypothetical protein